MEIKPVRDFDKNVLSCVYDLEKKFGRSRYIIGVDVYFEMFPNSDKYSVVESGVSGAIRRLKYRGLIAPSPVKTEHGFFITALGRMFILDGRNNIRRR